MLEDLAREAMDRFHAEPQDGHRMEIERRDWNETVIARQVCDCGWTGPWWKAALLEAKNESVKVCKGLQPASPRVQ